MKKKMLITAAIMTFLTSILHASFWLLGNWKAELPKLSHINQGILQTLNICSIFFLLFGTYVTYTIAGKENIEKTDRLYLVLVAGYFITRIIVGIPLFGFSFEEMIVEGYCLVAACCYLVPIKMHKQNEMKPGTADI